MISKHLFQKSIRTIALSLSLVAILIAGAAAIAANESTEEKPGTGQPKDLGPALPAQTQSRGTSSAQHLECVVVTNRTSKYVHIFVDDNFSGTIGPWGKLTVPVEPGSRSLYAKQYTNASTYSFWGPRVKTVEPSGWTEWTLGE